MLAVCSGAGSGNGFCKHHQPIRVARRASHLRVDGDVDIRDDERHDGAYEHEHAALPPDKRVRCIGGVERVRRERPEVAPRVDDERNDEERAEVCVYQIRPARLGGERPQRERCAVRLRLSVNRSGREGQVTHVERDERELDELVLREGRARVGNLGVLVLRLAEASRVACGLALRVAHE